MRATKFLQDASAPRLASICESFLARMASNLSSIEFVERAPTLSRSGTEPSGEPKFEEKSCNGELGIHGLCIIKRARVCHESRWETTKVGCRHLDKTKPEKLVKQKNHAHVRTRNGSIQNGQRRLPSTKSLRQCSSSKLICLTSSDFKFTRSPTSFRIKRNLLLLQKSCLTPHCHSIQRIVRSRSSLVFQYFVSSWYLSAEVLLHHGLELPHLIMHCLWHFSSFFPYPSCP